MTNNLFYKNQWDRRALKPINFNFHFIALNECRRIQVQLATSRIKFGPLEPELQPPKDAPRGSVMMSRNVIILHHLTGDIKYNLSRLTNAFDSGSTSLHTE